MFTNFQLPSFLQKALNDLGLQNPTPIQERAFLPILSGKDILAIAQTGTGKTFAYLLPILHQWKFKKTDTPQVAIIVPTRELVVQTVGEIEKLTKYTSIRTLGIYGGVNINTHRKGVYAGVDILVGTPGRTMDLALDGVLRFDTLQKLVIDEFDEILNLGFRFQMISILLMMKRKRQNILLSATMTDEVDEMLNDYFDIVDEISLAPSGTPLEKIKQKAYLVPNFLTKINIIKKLLQEDDYYRILLFVNNKKIADLVFEHLSKDFENEFDVIHSNKSQNYRLNVLRAFQEGLLRGIITTDVMARGLDFKDVSHVFNIQFSEIAEQYIHRIGRTGRAEKTGIALSFITPAEEEIKFAAEILMEKEIEMIEIPKNIEIAIQKLEFEKDFKKVKQLIKTNTIDLGGGAFHEKKDKNKKVNLGGPGKRNPKKTKPTNRGRLKNKF